MIEAVAGQRVAVNGADVLQFLLTDHLGSVSAVLTSTGSLVPGSEQRYLPFGGLRPIGTGVTQTDFGFTGQRNLAAVGLMDYNARWYGQTVGAFTQPDPVAPLFVDPQNLNRYTYVRNNPLNMTDPTGQVAISCLTSGSCGRPSGGPTCYYCRNSNGGSSNPDKIGPSLKKDGGNPETPSPTAQATVTLTSPQPIETPTPMPTDTATPNPPSTPTPSALGQWVDDWPRRISNPAFDLPWWMSSMSLVPGGPDPLTAYNPLEGPITGDPIKDEGFRLPIRVVSTVVDLLHRMFSHEAKAFYDIFPTPVPYSTGPREPNPSTPTPSSSPGSSPWLPTPTYPFPTGTP